MVRKNYKVAGHYFCIEGKNELFLWTQMQESYGPFEVHNTEAETLFCLTINDTIDYFDKVLVFSNTDTSNEGFMSISIYKTRNNDFYLEIRHPSSNEINAYLNINSNFSKAVLTLDGGIYEQWCSFNTAINLCYQLSVFGYNTLLLHASAIEYNGRAYLFLGKSGTGKSTHSRMWLKAIDKVTLMNDDHPIIRVWDNGDIIAYGSPWSGKTRCYKNIDAPLGGIIRIVRAMHNKAIRLSPIQSYASIMTSCGGIVWEKEFADGRDTTIQQIISRIPCWNMECLPNEEAAIICSTEVTKVWAK